MNTAIIVAAGSGTRLGGDRPKQFLEIAGKSVLIHTLERFENCPLIDEIILVLASNQITTYRQAASGRHFKKLSKIALGGKTRARSVFNGWKTVEAERTEIVLIHDGARPLVTIEEIAATVEKARETGAACLVAPVVDTIKEVLDGRIVRTVDRAKLRRALTPQAFRYEILQRVFADAELSAIATDECYLVEQTGHPIAVVEGSPRNIKITTPEDLAVAELFLQEIQNPKSKI